MGAMIVLGALAAAGAAAAAVLGLIWFVFKLILLPIRLALGVVKFVVGLAAGLLGMVAMVALAPLLLVGVGGVALAAIVVAGLAVLLPLLPFLLIGALVWSFMKRPAVSA
jgi:hypothetical protein